MRPGAGVRDVEVVAACLRGEGGGAFLDEGAELGGASFELAGFVVGRDPVGYFVDLEIVSVKFSHVGYSSSHLV